MSEEYDEAQTGEDGGMGGPGAPTPLTALEVSIQRHLLRGTTATVTNQPSNRASPA